MIHPTATEEKRIYFFAQWFLVLAAILIALIPIPASLISWIETQAPNWQNVQYLRLTLLLAGFGIAIQTYINQFRNQYEMISLIHHILITVLIIYVSVAIIVLGKYLFGIIPDLEVGQTIFLFTILPNSSLDLYSIENISEPPFLIPPYGPLYFAAARLLMKIVGESIFTLRLMTIFSLLVICFALKVITQKYSNNSWSWVTPAIFLALFPLITWSGPPTKPEYFAALFSICGLLVYYHSGFDDNKFWIIISGVFFVAALLIKFTILVGLMATLFHLLLRRKYLEFVGLFVFSLGLFLTICFWMNSVTNGGFLLFYFRGNSAHLQIWKIITNGFLGYLNNTFTVIASAAIVLLLTLEKSVKNLAGLVAISFFMALALFIISLGREGSSANYFLEGVIFGSLAIGLLIASAATSPNLKGFLCVVIFYLTLTLPTRAALIAQSYGDPDDAERIIEQLRALDVKEDEYILSDSYYHYAVYQAGLNPLLIDDLYYTFLAENKLVDPTILYGYLYNDQVPYLVLHLTLDEYASLDYGARHFTKELTVYLLQNYRCETIMKRWDGSSFVLCSRIPPVP